MTVSVNGGSVNVLGQKVRHPRAEGYNLLLADRWFRTIANADTRAQLASKDSLAQRVDQKGSVYENVLDLGYAWSRTDLSGGEGLDWDPRILALEQGDAALDQLRYWDSSGIDVSRPDTAGLPYTLRLSRGQTPWGGSLVEPKDIATSGTYIFIADGDKIAWFSSWEPSSIVATDVPKAGVDIVALAAAPNDTVVALCENGNAYAMRNYPNETVFQKIYGDGGATKLAAKGIWYVNGRFLMSAFDDVDTAQLNTLEYTSDGWQTEVEVDSASSPFWSVVESGPAIVAACGDGTVRTYAPSEKDGDMTLVAQARTTMPKGETPFLLGSNASVLLILTSMNRSDDDRQELRLYQGEVLSSQYNMSVGQIRLRREWSAVEHEPLTTRNMANTRDEIFWFVKESIPDTTHDHELFLESLWRFDLVTGGLSRMWTMAEIPNADPNLPPVQSEQTDLNGLVIFDSIAGGIDYNNRQIVLQDRDRFTDMGWMIFPNVTFGVNTDIAWMAHVLDVKGLAEGGTQVELYRSVDPAAILDWQHKSWVLVRRVSSPADVAGEVPMSGLESKSITFQLRIYSHTNRTGSPVVARTAARGIPSHRDMLAYANVNVSDIVSAPGRSPLRVPGLGETTHRAILHLIGKSVKAAVLKPPLVFEGVLNNVSEPVKYVSRRGSVTTFVTIELRGKIVHPLALPTGDSGVGLGTLGVATVGLTQSDRT